METIYEPTIEGTKRMFTDYEKEVARDEMIELEIDDIKEKRNKAREIAFIQFNEETKS